MMRPTYALHLVERVIPEVPVRQWVCSLPFRLRYLCGYDRKLYAGVLGAGCAGKRWLPRPTPSPGCSLATA